MYACSTTSKHSREKIESNNNSRLYSMLRLIALEVTIPMVYHTGIYGLNERVIFEAFLRQNKTKTDHFQRKSLLMDCWQQNRPKYHLCLGENYYSVKPCQSSKERSKQKMDKELASNRHILLNLRH